MCGHCGGYHCCLTTSKFLVPSNQPTGVYKRRISHEKICSIQQNLINSSAKLMPLCNNEYNVWHNVFITWFIQWITFRQGCFKTPFCLSVVCLVSRITLKLLKGFPRDLVEQQVIQFIWWTMLYVVKTTRWQFPKIANVPVTGSSPRILFTSAHQL